MTGLVDTVWVEIGGEVKLDHIIINTEQREIENPMPMPPPVFHHGINEYQIHVIIYLFFFSNFQDQLGLPP